MIRRLIPILLLLAVTFSGSAALAQSVECKLNVEYKGNSIRISNKTSTAHTAVIHAIRAGCLKHCGTENPKDNCSKDCYKSSTLNSIECFDENDTLIQPDREKARNSLISSHQNDSELVRNSHARKALLLTQWLGGKNSQKKKKPSLLLKDSKRETLLISPKSKKPPLLL